MKAEQEEEKARKAASETLKVQELALLEARMKAKQDLQVANASRKKALTNSESNLAETEEASKNLKVSTKRKAKPLKATEKVRIVSSHSLLGG